MKKEPGTRRSRWVTTLLGFLFFAQGLGKLLNPFGYVAALSPFDALPSAAIWPVGIAWLSAELLAGMGLIVAGLASHPPRLPSKTAAVLGLVITLAYAIMTTQAFARGLEITNCTCFGVYLAQRLSWFVLLQDAYMILYAGWVVRKLTAWR